MGPETKKTLDTSTRARLFTKLPEGYLVFVSVHDEDNDTDVSIELMPEPAKKGKLQDYVSLANEEPVPADEVLIWHGRIRLGPNWGLQATLKLGGAADVCVLKYIVEEPQ